MEGLSLKVAECSRQCPVCCDETIEELAARTDANIRIRSLTLSSLVTVVMVGAHIYFSYFDKVLPVPDIVWAIILAPWGGAAAQKILALLNKEKK